MTRSTFFTGALFASLVLLASLGTPEIARAQGPDVREIAPHVMLLLDTSGSMEKQPGCACQTPECTECLPVDPNTANRWGIVLQALTGQIDNYYWTALDRSAAPVLPSDPDYHYFIPHYQPQTTHNATSCAGAGLDWAPGFCQQSDGIIDAYEDRVRFGLMTFDTIPTIAGESQLRFETVYVTSPGTCQDGSCLNGQAQGGFSYGGPQRFVFPGCIDPHMLDLGARREGSSIPGGLVSMGQEGVDDILAVNDRVQASLLSRTLRPHGPTPIAGLISDYRYYLENHSDVVARVAAGGNGDPFEECRARFAILITDGRPNQDMRGDPINCDAPPSGTETYSCPYDLVDQQVHDLVDSGLVDGVYVVGFDVDPTLCGGDADCIQEATNTRATLDLIAAAGDPDNTRTALFANNRAELLAALSEILDATQPGATTRTRPAIGRVAASATSGGGQFQLNSGYQLERDENEPWEGRLERHRIECNALGLPERQVVDGAQRDLFHENLNNQSSIAGLTTSPGHGRRLLTVRAVSTANQTDHLYGNRQSDLRSAHASAPEATNMLDDSTIGHEGNHVLADVTTLAQVDWNVDSIAAVDDTDVENWLFGDVGSSDPTNASYNPRLDRRLGAIRHSSPSVVAIPGANTSDNSFNDFRDREEVANRPTVAYVASNDGILHAFVTTPYDVLAGPHSGTSFLGGEEIWGFVPPAAQPKIYTAMQIPATVLTDGSPVVEEVLLARIPGERADDYHATVLVGGMRGGGNAYYALDVTDPIEPTFLWQVTDSLMGETYATPAITQVRVELDAGGPHDRGVVILAGGHDNWDSAHGSAVGRPIDPNVDRGATGRVSRRNWSADGDELGQVLLVVDAMSGHVIRRFTAGTMDDQISAPLVGGVAAFPHGVGLNSTRAYTTDADGVIWRLDLSSSDPDDWELMPIYDMSHDLGSTNGQASYEAPVILTNEDGQLIILHATGDIDALDETDVTNRVVSLREETVYNATTGALASLDLYLNWEIELERGEQVTGPLTVFNEKVFFGSFLSQNDNINSCEYGSSRIWGVHYYQDQSASPLDPEPGMEYPANSGSVYAYIDKDDDPALDNAIIMGLSVVQRPSCDTVSDINVEDPVLGTRSVPSVTSSQPPSYQLVGLLSGVSVSNPNGGDVGEFSQDLPSPTPAIVRQGYAPTTAVRQLF